MGSKFKANFYIVELTIFTCTQSPYHQHSNFFLLHAHLSLPLATDIIVIDISGCLSLSSLFLPHPYSSLFWLSLRAYVWRLPSLFHTNLSLVHFILLWFCSLFFSGKKHKNARTHFILTAAWIWLNAEVKSCITHIWWYRFHYDENIVLSLSLTSHFQIKLNRSFEYV